MDSVGLFEQFVESNTHRSLAHIFLVVVLLYLSVRRFMLARAT